MPKIQLTISVRYVTNNKEENNTKTESKKAMTSYSHNKLPEEAQTKSSLKFLAVDKLVPGKPPLVWASAKHSPMETRKAAVKSNIMTGIYNLGRIQSRNKGQNQQKCLLCQK